MDAVGPFRRERALVADFATIRTIRSSDVFADRRPARGSTRTRSVEFASDKFLVPPQNGGRKSRGRHLAERFAVQSVADFAQQRALAV